MKTADSAEPSCTRLLPRHGVRGAAAAAPRQLASSPEQPYPGGG